MHTKISKKTLQKMSKTSIYAKLIQKKHFFSQTSTPKSNLFNTIHKYHELGTQNHEFLPKKSFLGINSKIHELGTKKPDFNYTFSRNFVTTNATKIADFSPGKSFFGTKSCNFSHNVTKKADLSLGKSFLGTKDTNFAQNVTKNGDFSLGKFFLGTRFINTKIPESIKFGENVAKNGDFSLGKYFLGTRFINLKIPEVGNFTKSSSFAKNVAKKPVKAIGDSVSRYRGALGLQIEAFWKRNSLFLWGAGGLMLCILLWRLMFGIANTFVGLSEGMAKYGFLALSSAIVAFSGLYLRSRFSINPDKVYRIAMRTLNTDAGILEVMGAPLTGTDLRAYVMSGGGVQLKKFKPGFRGKRCFLIFPIHGSERKGLVSVEVKNKKGQYDMKLLAVDIPMASGPDQRIFLIGNEDEYRVGGGLISELRDPVVKAMAAAKEFEDRDDREEEEDAERELQEAERKHQEEIERLKE